VGTTSACIVLPQPRIGAGGANPSTVVGPDGLPARVVGPWVTRKVNFVDKATTIFATGMKNKWPHRGYIELFAGPGLSWDRSGCEFIAGSAIRALDRNFTHYAFVDIDRYATVAPRDRIAARGRSQVAPVILGDCNGVVPAIHSAIPADALTLAFVDPTSWQVRLNTIAALTKDRRIDLLMTFHAGSMKRLARTASAPALDAIFGTDEWRTALRCPRPERMEALLRLYNHQLAPLGYVESWKHRLPVKNRKGVAMYQLVMFSKHSRGIDFWRKSIADDPDPSGQTRLSDWFDI
jgi:three-Cys-motif partner protein